MSWGDFKRSIGLNKLNTRSAGAKVAKVFPPAALMVPTKESLAAGAAALQQYGGVAKAAASGDAKGALSKAKDAAKFAKSAVKGAPRVSAPRPVQITAPVGAYEQRATLAQAGDLTLPQVAEEREAEISSSNRVALLAMAAAVGVFLLARAAR